jgi:cytochrome c-type biogenesis protein CcmF
MGGLWAYETQGWGGFWAWDPVENVSFVPWLLMAAFVHGLMVQVARNKWFSVNALLAGLPFLLFVYGTFLTRSGYLDKFSVHSFAQMDRTALWILLGLLVVMVVGFLGLWLTRGRLPQPEVSGIAAEPKGGDSQKERAFAAGTLLLSGSAVSIAIGMSVPFFCGLLGKDAKVVEEPLYHQVMVWFYAPVLLLMAVAPFLSWGLRSRAMRAGSLWYVLGIAALLLSAVVAMLHGTDWHASYDPTSKIEFPFGLMVPRLPWVLFLFLLAAIAIVANAWRLVELFKRSKLGVGGFLAHIGVAVTLGGLILSRGLEQKQQALIMQGTPGKALGYTVSFDRMTGDPSGDAQNKAVFSVIGAAQAGSFQALPGYSISTGQDGRPTAFTTPYIRHEWSHDVYVSLDSPQADLWDEPVRFLPGETKEGSDVAITYVRLLMHGSPGRPGTSVGAYLKVVEEGKPYYGEPRLSIDGTADSPQISPSLKATIVGLNANDGSILLQMPYTHTLFPVEIYYKPMTILVWFGAGLMTCGGLIAASRSLGRSGR